MNVLTFKKLIGAGTVAAVVALTPAVSMADGHGGRNDGVREVAFVIRTLEQHDQSFPKLIDVAETAASGIAIGIEIEDDVDRQGVEVTVLRDNEIVRVNMSPKTGQPLSVGSPEIIQSAVARISKRYDSLKSAKVSLREAIMTAEKAEQGVAYRARVDNEDGWACYEVQLMSNGVPIRVVIDPENGRIVGRMKGTDDHHGDD